MRQNACGNYSLDMRRSRECARGRAFAAPAPATAIAARRCNAMATANETWTVCRSKTAFCLRFGGRGMDRLRTSQPIALVFASLGLDDLFIAQIGLDPSSDIFEFRIGRHHVENSRPSLSAVAAVTNGHGCAGRGDT